MIFKDFFLVSKFLLVFFTCIKSPCCRRNIDVHMEVPPSCETRYLFLSGHVLLIIGFTCYVVGFTTVGWVDASGVRQGLWSSCQDSMCTEYSSSVKGVGASVYFYYFCVWHIVTARISHYSRTQPENCMLPITARQPTHF